MADWLDSFPLWAAAWAAVRGQSSAPHGAGIVTGPDGDHAHPEYVLPFPGDDADAAAEAVGRQPGAVLSLASADPEAALAFAANRGLVPVDQRLLLTAPTDQLNEAQKLPPDLDLAQAPLELYDLVEISVFDHPVASGRVKVEDGLAVIGGLQTQTPESGKSFRPAVLAALADEAYVHGADDLYTVVGPDEAAEYTVGAWTVAAHIVSLGASG